jgi:NitT/TauT family transport system substrate-binding protein
MPFVRPRAPATPTAFTRRGFVACLAVTPWLMACQPPLAPLRVGSIIFPGYESLFVARDLGWLDASRVRLVEMTSNTETLRALASGQLEAANLTLDEMMSARADGIPLRIVNVLDVSHGADVVMLRPGLPRPTVWRGRRIGVEDGAGGAIMLSALLDAHGLTLQDVVKVPMTLDRSVEVYQRGQVDAVVTAEPWASQLEAQGAVRVFDSTAIPGRIVDVLAVRSEALDTHASAVAHAVEVHDRVLGWLPQDPQRAAERMAPRLGVPPEAVMATFKGLQLPRRDEVRAMIAEGGALERTVTELQALMLARGLLARQLAWSELVDDRFVSTGG